jgi:hypothetical protein
MAFAVLFGALIGMGVLAWLLDHVEAPLHQREKTRPTDADLALVYQAKRDTRTGDQLLN